MDFLGPEGGQLAMSFGAGCVACWGFIQLALIGPLKAQLAELKEECEKREAQMSARIYQLETILLMHGSGPLRQDLQKAISEIHVDGNKA